MAESRQRVLRDACELLSSFLKFSLEPKPEQRKAVHSLLEGNDVLAVLPTGYGKSLIFQLFVVAASLDRKEQQTVLVVSPLKSIIDDQIAEAQGMGISAASAVDVSEEELRAAKFQLIFGSAEKVLERRFLDVLKDNSSSLHGKLAAIVIDESHTVEMWTGKRSEAKLNPAVAFREAFGRLSTLRSFSKQGTPMLAITGTADEKTQSVIIKQLVLKRPQKFYVSPNRENLRISVIKSKRESMLENLAWLVTLLKEKGPATPKCIIFCNGTLTDIAAVFNHLLMELGKAAYSPQDSQTSDNCLIGIYHSLTLTKYKTRVVDSFKGDGKKRVVIASSALSMGVNFPDVRYVIHWGPARNMLDYHQESGRGGRDSKSTHVLTIYYGQQISLCEDEVKAFLKTKGCYRVEAYKPFDKRIAPIQPLHDCCRNCAENCACSDNKCTAPLPAFELEKVNNVPQPIMSRPVSSSDKRDLQKALTEMVQLIIPTMNLLSENIPAGYGDDIVDVLVEKAHTIFTVIDVTEHIPLYSTHHALKILEVFHEFFEDIPNLDIMVELFGRGIPVTTLPAQPVEYSFDQSDSDSPVENEAEFF